jgi:hypothetical protein
LTRRATVVYSRFSQFADRHDIDSETSDRLLLHGALSSLEYIQKVPQHLTALKEIMQVASTVATQVKAVQFNLLTKQLPLGPVRVVFLSSPAADGISFSVSLLHYTGGFSI